MNLKEDVNLHPFVTASDPTDCTLVVVGGKLLKRFPEVLKKIDGKGFRTAYDSRGPDAPIRRNVKNVKKSYIFDFWVKMEQYRVRITIDNRKRGLTF